MAAGWNGWYSSAKRISCFVGILLLCASIAEIYLPSQIMRKWPAGGAVLQREGPVCIDLRIYFIREGFQFVHTVWVLFFLYMVSVSVFFFLLWAGLWCVRGRPVGIGV